MVGLELLSVHFGSLPFFGSVLGARLLEAVLALDAAIFVEHVLGRRLVHHESFSSFVVVRLLLVLDVVGVRLLLVECMDDSCMLILVIVVFSEGLVDH